MTLPGKALAVALNDGGLYRWGVFRIRPITGIVLTAIRAEPSACYEQRLDSLERMVIKTGCLTTNESDPRRLEYATGQRTDAED